MGPNLGIQTITQYYDFSIALKMLEMKVRLLANVQYCESLGQIQVKCQLLNYDILFLNEFPT